MAKKTGETKATESKKKRTRISQTDVPRFPLDQALRVPQAISENYAGDPTAPLRVAIAMDMEPNSGTFRNLCGAAIAYGLIEGGAKAEQIAITPLANRILHPTEQDDDLAARREAVMLPRVTREFLRKYDGSPIPREQIAQNVIVEMGIPRERANGVLGLVIETAASVGFLQDHKNKQYVDLSGAAAPSVDQTEEEGADDYPVERDKATPPPESHPAEGGGKTPQSQNGVSHHPQAGSADPSKSRRVFVTHGKNTAFIQPIKELLKFGELEAVVSVENQSVSQPVPDKVMNDMRTCGAAIIHVDAEKRMMDQDAKEHIVLNPNVLIEIGAAMALYGRRFILLVKQGVTLPSNLQGLYEVRYDGEALDGNATIQLLKAINDIKNHPVP